jgi:ABC-2 type transport system permease protein
MGRLIKYQLKGSYKVICILLSITLILGLLIHTRIGKWMGDVIIGVSSLIIFGIYLAAFIFIIGLFRKDLYEDTGYLTFTLPLTGNQVVGAHLITSIIWSIVLGIVLGALTYFNIRTIAEPYGQFFDMSLLFNKTSFLLGIVTFLSGVSFILLIYFSMAISRVTIRNKKVGGFWFVIFLILSALLSLFQYKLSVWFPQYINIYSGEILKANMYAIPSVVVQYMGLMFATGEGAYLSIAGAIFGIIKIVALFLGTGYLIENKIDL